MANTYIRARSPKGNVGVTDVVDAGELSAYSAGVLSGFTAASAASWTLQIGGVSGTQDVAIAKNPGGESELFSGTAGQSIAFVIGGAPGTPGQSRTDALVIYKDPFTTSVVNNGVDVTDYQVVAGTAATTGSQVPPNDAAIRAAIPTGSLKFVVVIGYVTTAYGASSTTTGAYSRGMAGNMSTPVVVANITERGYLPLIAGTKCYQTDNAMEQICDGTSWNNIPRLLKKVTLTSAGDTISVTGIPARDELEVRGHIIASGVLNWGFRFNNDSGGNYAINISTNFAAPSLVYSLNNLYCGAIGAVSHKVNLKVLNPTSRVKLVTGITHDDAASVLPTNVGNVTQMGGKWCNTSAQIDRVDFFNVGAGDFAVGSYVEVWG